MDNTPVRGVVAESLAAGLYRVRLDDGREKLCYVAGKMKHNKIRVLIGDKVDVIVDLYGGTATNRIVKRIDREH